jgi:hypothetical protein
MASGRSNQLTKQIGEYLVACELARKGLLVATFSGNVPDFDLIATDGKGRSCPIQVKTVRLGSWQFSIDNFVNITLDGDRQVIGEKKPLAIPQLVCVFVVAGNKYGEDRFYVLEWAQVQGILIANHRHWLDAHGGVRPKKADSMHCTLLQSDLEIYKDNWPIITNKFQPVPADGA